MEGPDRKEAPAALSGGLLAQKGVASPAASSERADAPEPAAAAPSQGTSPGTATGMATGRYVGMFFLGALVPLAFAAGWLMFDRDGFVRDRHAATPASAPGPAAGAPSALRATPPSPEMVRAPAPIPADPLRATPKPMQRSAVDTAVEPAGPDTSATTAPAAKAPADSVAMSAPPVAEPAPVAAPETKSETKSAGAAADAAMGKDEPPAAKPDPSPERADAPAAPAVPPEPSAGNGAQIAALPPSPSSAPPPTPRPRDATPATSSAAPAKPAAGSGYAVQVASVGNEAAAGREIARLRRAHGEVLGGRDIDFVDAEVKGSTVYRIRIGPMAAVGDASRLCASLRKRRQDCLVVKLAP